MTNVVKTLKESKSACWIAWACLVVPMFASYFFDDMFSTISHIFKNPEMLELGWNTMDYGSTQAVIHSYVFGEALLYVVCFLTNGAYELQVQSL